MIEEGATDSLTGLKNREALFLDVTMSALSAERSQGVLKKCYLCLDIDNFQKYLDVNGYGPSDQLLILVSRQLKMDFAGRNIYRVGGDEFVVEDAETLSPSLFSGLPVVIKSSRVVINTRIEKGRHHRASGWILLHIFEGIVCSSVKGKIVRCKNRK